MIDMFFVVKCDIYIYIYKHGYLMVIQWEYCGQEETIPENCPLQSAVLPSPNG